MAVCGDERADVCYGAYVLEETSVGTRHIRAHVVDEVCRRPLLDCCCGCVMRFAASGTMLDSKDQVEELDDGRLSVAATTVLNVGVVLAVCVEHDAVGEAGFVHVLAAGKERANAVVEDVGVAVLVHADEH